MARCRSSCATSGVALTLDFCFPLSVALGVDCCASSGRESCAVSGAVSAADDFSLAYVNENMERSTSSFLRPDSELLPDVTRSGNISPSFAAHVGQVHSTLLHHHPINHEYCLNTGERENSLLFGQNSTLLVRPVDSANSSLGLCRKEGDDGQKGGSNSPCGLPVLWVISSN